MNTNLSNRISEMEEEEITVIRYMPDEKIESLRVRFLRPILKWFGFLSTMAWGVAAIFPGAFRIPAYAQGWVFVTAVFWLVAFCAGFFNL